MVEGLLESTPARRRPRSTSSARAKHLQPVAAELSPDVLEPPSPEFDTDSVRVLVASHSHPYLTRGGAEIAAFQLFRALQEKPGHEAWFLGCQNQNSAERLGAAITQPFSEREFIYSTGAFEWFRFANRDPRFPKEFVALLQHLQPDVVHFHHFINFGVEVFAHVRRALPRVRIVLTLHEYLAICHHFGQMITTKRQNLCYESGPVRCNQCFPDLGPADFFLRQRYIERFFDLVDHFICPSHFLADRFIAWGLPESRIGVLENVIPETTQRLPRPRNLIDGPLRVGFFGQISRLKGINVLFDTAQSLESEGFEDVVFEIHGDHRGQPPQFQEEFLQRLEKAGRNVRFHGPYEPQRVDLLMQQVDVTIIPSIWWENSPVVIQEAMRNRKPIICSDIGGMAEKVRDGVDGWHFPVGSALSLAALLKRLAANRQMISEMSTGMQLPPTTERIVDDHVRLYQRLAEAVR